MWRRSGCLAPIALTFVVGVTVLAWGLVAESQTTVRVGVICLIVAAALLIAGLIARHRGWWA